MRNEFKNSIATFLQIPSDRLSDESTNLSDLVSESFVLIELVIQLQDEHKIRLNQEDLTNVKTLSDLLDVLVLKKNN